MEKKRISFYMLADELRELGRIKQDLFFDKTWSDLYRAVFVAGVKALRSKEK